MSFQIDPFRRGVRFNGARGACFLLAPEPVCKRLDCAAYLLADRTSFRAILGQNVVEQN